MPSLFARYCAFVLRHRLLVGVVCVVVSIAAGFSLTRATLTTSIARLVLGESNEYLRYRELIEQFGSDEQLVVGWEVSASDGARLPGVVRQLEAMPEVRRVHSSQQLFGLFPELVQGVLRSEDGRHEAIAIELRADGSRSIEDSPRLVGEIQGAFVASGFDARSLHMAGTPAILAEIERQTREQMFRFTPAVALLILAMTLLLLRGLWPVVMTLVVGALATLWTMGLAIAIDHEINIVLAAAPALILLISFSDVIHLYNAYWVELRSGHERTVAVHRCAEEVGRACIYTSLTTLVGFLGLTLVGIPILRTAGITLGFGVAIALLLAMTLVPVMLSLLPTPSVGPRRSSSLDKLVDAHARVAGRHPVAVLIAFAVVIALGVVGSSRIEFETDLVGRMPADNPLRVDAAYFAENFSGSATVDVYVTASESVLSEQCRMTLREVPGVERVLTSPHSAFGDTGQPTRRFVLLTAETGANAIYEIGEAARKSLQTALGPDAVVEATGLLYLAGHWLVTQLGAQLWPLFVSLAVVAAMMVWIVRSVALGLLAMVPNLIPLLCVGGVLGFVWNPVDSDAVVAVLVAIGIAVDDTIHFMVRYRAERSRGMSSRQAIDRTFEFAGRAILTTSLIFAIGLAPFLFADYLTLRLLGVLLPVAMLAAVLGDLLLLPALLRVSSRVTGYGPRPRS